VCITLEKVLHNEQLGTWVAVTNQHQTNVQTCHSS